MVSGFLNKTISTELKTKSHPVWLRVISSGDRFLILTFQIREAEVAMNALKRTTSVPGMNMLFRVDPPV